MEQLGSASRSVRQGNVYLEGNEEVHTLQNKNEPNLPTPATNYNFGLFLLIYLK